MSRGPPWLMPLVVTVHGLAPHRAPELLAGLGAAERDAAACCAATLAALARTDRHGRIAALGARSLEARELAARLARLSPGLRAAVVEALPPALRPRRMPVVSATTGEAARRWGARLAREWSAARPRDPGTPSLPPDSRDDDLARPRRWPAS